MLVTEVNSFQLSTIATKSSILDVCKGLSWENFILFDKKSYLIQFKSYSWRKSYLL